MVDAAVAGVATTNQTVQGQTETLATTKSNLVPTQGTTVFFIPATAGSYLVTVYHDANRDGLLSAGEASATASWTILADALPSITFTKYGTSLIKAQAGAGNYGQLVKVSLRNGTTPWALASNEKITLTDPAGLADLAAYFELHIEQGALLENAGKDIGVVTHALAQAWYEVTIEGAESHGGSPMAGRRDAMMAAAPLMAAIEEIALNAISPAGEPGRATVGRLTVYPDSRNIAPSRIWFSIDTRHGDPAMLARMGSEIRAKAAELSAARGVAITISDFWQSPLTPFDAALVGRVRDAASRLGLPHMDMPTGIGHDAVYVARRVPAAMIFCPCHGGISHNEAESITPAWAEAGLRVLADAVLATAGIAKEK
ncbi:MAG: M20/M25/M40 family metallo-hydrolase [Acetobacteraceae bacterium]|nr:M20/M25/M40 family metallo-hydrolase [Acetobacteraceae bacterium]